MKIIKEIDDLRRWIDAQKKKGLSIGFVPTMGALHQGHLSLIEAASASCSRVVCSIFVNPTQFNNSADLEAYPRTTTVDLALLLESGHCDAVFIPSVAEVYPTGALANAVNYGIITNDLEGSYRPRHFDGVVMIVRKLLDWVSPDIAFFGQKDYQQCMVVSALIKDESIPVKLSIQPIIREPDGLAMSSRNSRLSAEGRKKATSIYSTLTYLKKQISMGDNEKLTEKAFTMLENAGLKTEYIDIRETDSFKEASLSNTGKKVILIAAWCDGVRLIDNLLID